MHSLPERLLSHIRRQDLLKAGDRVGVAVSGGIDSVALLRLLLELRGELGIVLSVVHFNHKLRGEESDGDQQFVADLARAHGLEFFSDNDDVAQRAADERLGVEAAARELRYGFFRHLLGEAEDSETLGEGVKDPTLSHRTRQGWGNRTSEGPDTTSHDLDTIGTGHTLDDQAETVLMRMIRGSGLRGIVGIHPRIAVENDSGEVCGEIVRPLLGVRRRDLEQYLNDIGQPWREDSTNADHAFTRNRVRKLLVPILEKEFNPEVAESLADLAEIARGEEDYWENEVAGWMGTAVHWIEPDWVRVETKRDALVHILLPGSDPQGRESRKTPAKGTQDRVHTSLSNDDLQARIDHVPWLVANASVSRPWLLSEPVAVQRRVVKAIGDHARIPLEFKHIDEILRFAEEEGPSGKELSLPLGWTVRRHPEELLFVTPDLRGRAKAQDYEYSLSLSGHVTVHECGSTFEALSIPAEALAAYNPDELLDADSVTGSLRVRNWRAGDRFWPAHTKSPKKIKELLQERHVAQPERAVWPVVLSGDEIVWVRGFPVHTRYRAKAGGASIRIREKLLIDDTEN